MTTSETMTRAATPDGVSLSKPATAAEAAIVSPAALAFLAGL